MIDRLPAARALSAVLWVVLLFGLGLGVGWHLAQPRAPAPQVDERAVLTILRSQQMAFLVTRRTAAQIVIDHRESNVWGEWRGLLWGVATWRWGVDLTKIGPDDLTRQGDAVVVRLPEPQLLDFAVEPGSLGYLSKSTSVPKVLDFCRGGWQRSVLDAQFRDHALKFAADHHLLPTRAEIIAQLNASSGLLSSALGVRVRFE